MLEDKQSTIEIDEIADASIAIESLPPLPLPDTATIRQEQATGWMIVGGAILGCLLVAHAAHFIAGIAARAASERDGLTRVHAHPHARACFACS